jgi:DtxR family transcriptional regulator, Mn-dependent transcriptional regulator
VSGDLIDTTEMYLRTIFELEEEGVVPLRARIAERLHQSGPTVSQTVARMERDGLLLVADDRHLELTDAGRAYATRVMRKHRLAERLLVDVIGLDWELVHDEACRWEHVISEDVERRLVAILDGPRESPYGNPIPGMVELHPDAPPAEEFRQAAVQLAHALGEGGPVTVQIRRIAEPLQSDHAAMSALRRVGALPGARVEASRTASGALLRSGGDLAVLTAEQAEHLYVREDAT